MWINKTVVINSFWIFIILIKSVCGNVNDYEITCKDENGNNVDWYYLYKLPSHFVGNKRSTADKKGLMYAYISSNAPNEVFTLSDYSVNELKSMPGQTLAQAYFDSNEVDSDRLVIAYNDEPPNKKSNSRKGHLKGVVVADERSGFWMVHSVPLYPNISTSSDKYYYPPTGTVYGQSFLCLSLDAEQINIVGNQLIYNEPQLYETKFPKTFEKLYPNNERLIQLQRIKDGPFSSQVDLKTLSNQIFTSFAKSSKFSKELYEDLVAPALDTNLYVETWRKGPGNFPSNCTKATRVWNISKVKINEQYSFPTTDDHSKWGVSDDKSDWICVGDINRAMKQMQRGGGTVCHRSKPISEIYRSLIVDFEPCKQVKFKTFSRPYIFDYYKYNWSP